MIVASMVPCVHHYIDSFPIEMLICLGNAEPPLRPGRYVSRDPSTAQRCSACMAAGKLVVVRNLDIAEGPQCTLTLEASQQRHSGQFCG